MVANYYTSCQYDHDTETYLVLVVKFTELISEFLKKKDAKLEPLLRVITSYNFFSSLKRSVNKDGSTNHGI